jgi:hypothetical protein
MVDVDLGSEPAGLTKDPKAKGAKPRIIVWDTYIAQHVRVKWIATVGASIRTRRVRKPAELLKANDRRTPIAVQRR